MKCRAVGVFKGLDSIGKAGGPKTALSQPLRTATLVREGVHPGTVLQK